MYEIPRLKCLMGGDMCILCTQPSKTLLRARYNTQRNALPGTTNWAEQPLVPPCSSWWKSKPCQLGEAFFGAVLPCTNYKRVQTQPFSKCGGDGVGRSLHLCEKHNYFLCFQILNPVWSCQWGLMEALDRRIPIWLADG